jgi:hypothetical protein
MGHDSAVIQILSSFHDDPGLRKFRIKALDPVCSSQDSFSPDMWSSFPGILPMYGLAALGCVSSVAADYYIDNANNTVAYAASGTSWQTFSFATQNLTLVLGNANVTVDSSKCYDGN